MSSNPTQPKSTAPEGVNFPPEDDAEGHRFIPSAEGDGQPDGFLARQADEGFAARATPEGAEDDTEGHRIYMSADGDDDTEGHRIALLADTEDDTEGHRVVAFSEGGPDSGPEGVAVR